MLKKFVFMFCTLCLSLSSFIEAANEPSIHYSPQLQEVIATIQKLPEVNSLMTTIQQEGAISILVTKHNSVCQQFGACWDPDRRIIFVNLTDKPSRGTLIGSILFELQNALVNEKIQHYDRLACRGEIDKEDYVRAIEYLEYQNSLNASRLATKGIQMGLFPPSAHLETYSNFEEHYYYQKKSGHSACIARNFDHMAPRDRNGS